jgi:hypothetical protein
MASASTPTTAAVILAARVTSGVPSRSSFLALVRADLRVASPAMAVFLAVARGAQWLGRALYVKDGA